MSFLWVGIEFREVAGAARGEFVREGSTRDFFESMDHFEHRSRMAGAEVVDIEAGFKPLDGGEVTFGEVYYMDVIAEAGAVFGFVVIAENVEFGELAGSNFHDIGHEVVWDAVGVFAEKTGVVITDRVKVAESDDLELGVGCCEVF